MQSDLIFDVGMHTGEDTAFYLKKGFRVVAVEANTKLVGEAEARFEAEVESGQLRIVAAAIGRNPGRTTFYANDQKDDWGTTDPEFVARNIGFGTTHSASEVPCVTFSSVLETHGTPYYLKIDIEGADLLCLEAMLGRADRPRFVSIESSLTSFEGVFGELSHLWVLGYRGFKIVDQAQNSEVRCPDPPLEGVFVDQRFDGHMSGPFGDEAPGEWQPIGPTLDRYRELLSLQAKHDRGAGESGLDRWLSRLTRRQAPGWYDIHGRLGD